MKITSIKPNIGMSYSFFLVGLTQTVNGYIETSSTYHLQGKVPPKYILIEKINALKNQNIEVDKANIVLEINVDLFTTNLKVESGRVFHLAKTIPDYIIAFYENVVILSEAERNLPTTGWQLPTDPPIVEKDVDNTPIVEKEDEFKKLTLLSKSNPLLSEDLDAYWKIKIEELKSCGINTINLEEVRVNEIFSILDQYNGRTNIKEIIDSIFKIILNYNLAYSPISENIEDNVYINLIRDIIENEIVQVESNLKMEV